MTANKPEKKRQSFRVGPVPHKGFNFNEQTRRPADQPTSGPAYQPTSRPANQFPLLLLPPTVGDNLQKSASPTLQLRASTHNQGRIGCTPQVFWIFWMHHQPRGSQTCLCRDLTVPKAQPGSKRKSHSRPQAAGGYCNLIVVIMK